MAKAYRPNFVYKKYAWHCIVEAKTTREDGKSIFMRRHFDGSGDVYKAALACISKRKDNGRQFLGCKVTIHTPLHNIELILEDRLTFNGFERVFESVDVRQRGNFANMDELEALVNHNANLQD